MADEKQDKKSPIKPQSQFEVCLEGSEKMKLKIKAENEESAIDKYKIHWGIISTEKKILVSQVEA